MLLYLKWIVLIHPINTCLCVIVIKRISFFRDNLHTFPLTLLWRRLLSYRNQFIDLRSKSMDWFLYDNGLRHERVNTKGLVSCNCFVKSLVYRNNFILWEATLIFTARHMLYTQATVSWYDIISLCKRILSNLIG